MIPGLDCFRGSLFGLAIGDALGSAIEFQPPGTFEPVTNFRGGGPFNLNPGEWTDDTSMALCLADSLINCADFSLYDQLNRYCKWYQEGYLSCNGHCFDIGTTTRHALNNFLIGKNDCGQRYPRSLGNGSLMRLAPVPLVFSCQPETAIFLSGESSRATHALPVCIDACRYYGGLIVGALQNRAKKDLLSPIFSPIDNYWNKFPLTKEIQAVASGSFRLKEPPEIRGSGFVCDSLESALWAFFKTESFEEGCLAAVNLGEDADTTGAIYGQLAGAFYGIDGIPKEWISGLAKGTLINEFSEKLYQLHLNLNQLNRKIPNVESVQ